MTSLAQPLVCHHPEVYLHLPCVLLQQKKAAAVFVRCLAERLQALLPNPSTPSYRPYTPPPRHQEPRLASHTSTLVFPPKRSTRSPGSGECWIICWTIFQIRWLSLRHPRGRLLAQHRRHSTPLDGKGGPKARNVKRTREKVLSPSALCRNVPSDRVGKGDADSESFYLVNKGAISTSQQDTETPRNR